MKARNYPVTLLLSGGTRVSTYVSAVNRHNAVRMALAYAEARGFRLSFPADATLGSTLYGGAVRVGRPV